MLIVGSLPDPNLFGLAAADSSTMVNKQAKQPAAKAPAEQNSVNQRGEEWQAERLTGAHGPARRKRNAARRTPHVRTHTHCRAARMLRQTLTTAGNE